MAADWMKWLAFGLLIILLFGGFQWLQRFRNSEGGIDGLKREITPDYRHSPYGQIYLAGGCFWGVEAYFGRMKGVLYTNVGYANGGGSQTSYSSIGRTGHAEAVYIVYDPQKITLETLLTTYYRIIDPLSLNRQGNDVGVQYRTGIYYVKDEDRAIIEAVTARVEAELGQKVAVERAPLTNYVMAEEYHQEYLDKNPGGYCHIPLVDIPNEKPLIKARNYPKPSEGEIRSSLTKEQYDITQGKGTEPAFRNAYWDLKDKGLYVDVVTGEPLFSSLDKYDSGSGWPSFSKPIQWNVVEYQWDHTAGMKRVEVLSRSGKTHMGHVFRDGPREEGGLRFCMNSGALRFVPYERLEEEGYGALKYLF